jgi:anthranilate synthase component 1
MRAMVARLRSATLRAVQELKESFDRQMREGPLAILSRRLMSDQLTPVLAYRRLVLPDERTAPSFLFESVENGSSVGRHSILGARPLLELSARAGDATIVDHRDGTRRAFASDDPLAVREIMTQVDEAGPVPQLATAMPGAARTRHPSLASATQRPRAPSPVAATASQAPRSDHSNAAGRTQTWSLFSMTA